MNTGLALVTVLFNSDDVLPGFFQSLARQVYTDFKLFLVDNSPSEQTRTTLSSLRQQYPSIELNHIESDRNVGVAAANNIGIKQGLAAGYQHLLVLNNDIEFDSPGLFSELLAMAGTGKKIIVPKIYYYGSDKLWFAGGDFIEWQCQVKHFGMNETDIGSYNEPRLIRYAPTCFAYVSREVFETVGVMDEKYFVYVDDTDFMYRAGKAGFHIWYEPSLTIAHKVSFTTGGSSSDFAYYFNSRNRIYFARKFLQGGMRFSAYLYTAASLLYFSAKQKRVSAVRSVIRGLKEGMKL